jgi:hypothetical protein
MDTVPVCVMKNCGDPCVMCIPVYKISENPDAGREILRKFAFVLLVRYDSVSTFWSMFAEFQFWSQCCWAGAASKWYQFWNLHFIIKMRRVRAGPGASVSDPDPHSISFLDPEIDPNSECRSRSRKCKISNN